MGPDSFSTTVVAALNAQQRSQVAELLTRATTTDGVTPLNEHARLEAARGRSTDGIAHLLATLDLDRGDQQIVGYAFLDSTTDDPIAQLVVDPAHRRRGIATAMVGELGFDPRDPGGRWRQQSLRTWSFGDLPAARKLAGRLGMRPVRELLVMERDTNDLPEPKLPQGVTVRGFRPEDVDQVLQINSRAFAHHPEQGGMTRQDLQDRMNEPWFDPEGLLIATHTGDDQIIGFHWTKVHDTSLGEVYVIAVGPDSSGGGLGRQLLYAGLRHLASRGVRRIILYVEGDQDYVVKLYLSARFVIANRDVVYASPSPARRS